jgi:hypothetical protein
MIEFSIYFYLVRLGNFLIFLWFKKDSPVHVALACVGSRKVSDHFGSYVRSLSLQTELEKNKVVLVLVLADTPFHDLETNCTTLDTPIIISCRQKLSLTNVGTCVK